MEGTVVRFFLFGIALLLLMASPLLAVGSLESKDPCTVSPESGMISHAPISITSNEDFLSQKNSSNWDGNGSVGYPIIISNYLIESELDCISISNVSLHFTIQKCELAFGSTNGGNGISLRNCENAVISNCSIHMKSHGVSITDSYMIAIESVIINGCQVGARVVNSDVVWFVNSSLAWNENTGLLLDGTRHVYCEGGSLTNNPLRGIRCINDDSTHLRRNEVGSGEVGILSTNSSNWVCEELCATNCTTGVLLEDTQGGFLLDSVIHSCTAHGIYLDEHTTNVTLLMNSLGPNAGYNAYDDGIDNQWDEHYSEIGNLWADYIGSGYYYIPGSANSIDHYPNRTSNSTTTSNGTATNIPFGEITLAASICSVIIVIIALVAFTRGRR